MRWLQNIPYVQLFKTVWQHGAAYRPGIVTYYVAFILAQICLSLTPYTFGKTVDALQHLSTSTVHQVIFWVGMNVVLVLLFWMLHGPARVLERRIALKIQQQFRLDFYHKLTRLPLKWHQDHHSGNLITRITRASTALRTFAETQFIYIETTLMFLVSIGFLLWISIPVGILSFISCALGTWIVLWFDKKLVPLYQAQNNIENHIGSIHHDYLSNMTTILTLRLSALTQNNLLKHMLTLWPFFKKDCVLNEEKWFLMRFFLSICQSSILIGYIIYTLNTMDAIMIGLVVMIFRYQAELTDVFFNLSMHYSELVKANAHIQNLNPLLNDMDALSEPEPAIDATTEWHTLTIHDLTFSHQQGSRNKTILNNLSFTLQRGEKIALIGTSGGGKSTLMNVLRGVYTAQHGHLTVDGEPLTNLNFLKEITTLIPQDPELFESTLLFNITLGLDTTAERLNQAMTQAAFLPVLHELPEGLETDLREKGLNFSVGQKQRLALARGLFAARLSSLILMDEPTSSIDLPTEKHILSNIIKDFPESTVIVSLHRLHLLPLFDRIILLDNGKIVADGSPTQLLHQPGPVRELWLTAE